MPFKTEADVNKFDPNRSPFSAQRKTWDLIPHPQGENGYIKVDRATKQVQPIADLAFPIWLPEGLRNVDQPNVFTCSQPGPNNRGCHAWNGCPIAEKWPKNQPCNVIVMKEGIVDSVRCFHAYTGMTRSGRPTSQAHYVMSGWEVMTDRTTIEQNVVEGFVDEGGVKRSREYKRTVEVPDLAPFYVKEEAPKRRGRPRKNDRESQPSA